MHDGNDSLVVEIDGRRALPVRAIPLATRWGWSPCGMAPDVLVRTLRTPLACRHPFDSLRATSAYTQRSGKAVELLPSDWTEVLVQLDGLTAEIKAKFPDAEGDVDPQGNAEWRARSVEALPPGVFVWLDNFEADFRRNYDEGALAAGLKAHNDRTSVLNEMRRARGQEELSDTLSEEQAREQGAKSLGDRELNLAPLSISDGVLEMIRQGFDPPAQQHADPEAKAASPMAESESGGLQAAADGPPPLTTGEIAFSFAGLRWDQEHWKKPLGDKPKWLAACIATPGQRGVTETRWNPVLIGAALVRAGHAKPNSVRAKFQTQPLLIAWLDAWKTYEADHIESK